LTLTALLAAAAHNSTVIVDMSATVFCDCSGVHVGHYKPGKCALACLPRSVDDHDAGIGQGSGDGRLRMTGDEVHCRLRHATISREWLISRVERG